MKNTINKIKELETQTLKGVKDQLDSSVEDRFKIEMIRSIISKYRLQKSIYFNNNLEPEIKAEPTE